MQCWSRIDSEKALDAYRYSTDAAILRASLGNLIAYADQVKRRRQKIKETEPLPPFPCACGRAGCMVTGASRYGRRRAYANGSCRMYAQRRRDRLRAIQGREGNEELVLPAQWSRAQFDQWWASQRDE